MYVYTRERERERRLRAMIVIHREKDGDINYERRRAGSLQKMSKREKEERRERELDALRDRSVCAHCLALFCYWAVVSLQLFEPGK